MGGGIGRVIHHDEYYLDDGSVSFLTGNTLFRVHRSFFQRESDFFRELFANAAEDDPDSGTDAKPFTLNDVPADDFAQLLWVWYDREYSYQIQTKANWLTILKLSTRWKFNKMRELAVRELEALELPPAERISIYNQHRIDGERLVSSYVELCKSPTVPTEAEGHLLQMDSLIKVLQAREDAQRKAVKLGRTSPTSASLEEGDLREIVYTLLGQGLDSRSGGNPTGSGNQAPHTNGERTRGTTADTSTVRLKTPQAPEKGKPAGGPPTRNEEGQGEQKKDVDGSDKERLAKAEKERKEKEKQEKVREAKEKQEKERMEKVKQDQRQTGKPWGK